jgi:hypothetical protein
VETTESTTLTLPRKPEWPSEVPILSGEFICPGFWSSFNGEKLGLLEWLNKTFDPFELMVNPVRDEAYQVLRTVLAEHTEGSIVGMPDLDVEALFDADRAAVIWNEAMRRLGYENDG